MLAETVFNITHNGSIRMYTFCFLLVTVFGYSNYSETNGGVAIARHLPDIFWIIHGNCLYFLDRDLLKSTKHKPQMP